MAIVKSISMFVGHHEPHQRRMVHCVMCGSPLIQINGAVKSIVFGDVQQELKERSVTIRCRKRLRDHFGNNYSCGTELTIMDA